MPPTPRRRFTILDGMALLAAVAVGLAVTLADRGRPRFIAIEGGELTSPTTYSYVTRPPLGGGWGGEILHRGISASIGLAALPPMLLLLRLVPPRPPARRLFRQPGAIASVAASVAMAVPGLTHGIYAVAYNALVYKTTDYSALLFRWGFVASYSAGVAVAGAWLTLILGHRWLPERSWIDRLGRVLGVYWVAIAAWLLACGL